MSTFSLNGRIGLNVSDLVSNADKARKAVTEIGDELDDVDGKKTEPTVSVDDKASAALVDIGSELDGLNGETAAPTVKIDDKASGELGVISREVSGLDGETAAPTVKIDDKASGALDDIEKQLSKDLPDAAEKGGDDAAANLEGGFDDLKGKAGKLLGGAVGAAIVAGLHQGMERIAVRAQITQQFGLIEEDAARLGKQAADIYAGGWGEGTMEVLASLAQIDQRLVQTGAVGVEETARIGESATVLAEVFGMDVTEVIEAVGKLMINGLAPDAQTAMDLLGAAMQQGGNAAGDLFESVDEYAQHFADFGLGAEDMMALFVHGMQNGQRDTDKLADAVKEMRIRTVDSVDGISAAYADLGLDADVYRLKILAGGPSAKKAFGEIVDAIRSVEDPIERNRLAVEMMGTPIEDLGIKALDSFAAMGGGLEDFNGTVDDMNVAMTAAQSSSERLFRSFKVDAGNATETAAGLLEQLFGVAEVVSDFGNKPFFGDQDASVEALIETTTGVVKLSDAVLELVDAQDDEAEVSMELRAHYTKLSQKIELNTKMEELAAKASVKTAEALEEERRAAEDLANHIDSLTDAHANLVGSEMDVEEAIWDAQDASLAFGIALQNNELTGRGFEEALNDVTRAQLSAADATAEHLIAIIEKDGAELTSIDKTRIHTDALKGLAETLEGPLRTELDKHVEALEAIPGDVGTVVGLDLETVPAHLLLLQGMLDTIPTTRTVTVTTVFDTGGFEGMLADGGPAKAGGAYLVGEEGPELVTFGRDSFVHDAAQTSAMLARGAGSPATGGIGVSGPAPSSMANRSTGSVTAGDVNVSVQIGQTELRDMIQDVVISHERQKELVQ